jgi:hypothetical protein
VCRDVRVLWLLWQLGVAQWRARGFGGDLGARPVSSRRELRILGPMWTLISLSDSIFISLSLCFKLEHFIIYVSVFNSRIHIITLYSGHVCVYYASTLRCWHLVWIMVRTDHPCLGVGCHNVESKHTWDHLVDASIKTMKYLKWLLNGCMGSQISPWMCLRNLNDSTWILSGECHKISFLIAHEVHTKLLDFKNLTSFKSW